MVVLKQGTELKLDNGDSIKVVGDKPLGKGGQGSVYLVEYNGKKYALKWYTNPDILNNQAFKKNLAENVDSPAPSDKFLWPQHMTETKDGSFGYIMDLIPDGYNSMSDLLLTWKFNKVTGKHDPVRFYNLETMTKAAINFVKAFRDLHRRGLSFQDINDGGVFFDTKTGEVRICDCDNIAPDDYNFGIAGKPMYMAPEVVLGSLPNVESDKFSLALMLFKFFIGGDPLQGKAFISEEFASEEVMRRYYGTNPIFIYDPDDESNRPDPAVHPNVVKNWPDYPRYIKKAFVQSFTVGLKNPMARLIDADWLDLISKLRSDIVTCKCGETFTATPLSNKTEYVCPYCGERYPVFKIYWNGDEIRVKDRIPLTHTNKLYRNQIDPNHSDDFDTVVAVVSESASKPGVYGLKNVSDDEWFVTTGRERRIMQKGNGASLKVLKEIDFGNSVKGKIER